MSQIVEDTLLEMLSQVPQGESISPNDVAKRICVIGDKTRWQRELPKVRAVAINLARAGRIEVTRKGKPIEPEGFKGIYSLRLKTTDQ